MHVSELFEPIYNHSFEFFVWEFFYAALIGDHYYGVGNVWKRHVVFFSVCCLYFCTETFASEVSWLCEFFFPSFFFYFLSSLPSFFFPSYFFAWRQLQCSESTKSMPYPGSSLLAAYSHSYWCVLQVPTYLGSYPRVKFGPLLTSALCYGFLCTWVSYPLLPQPYYISEPSCALEHLTLGQKWHLHCFFHFFCILFAGGHPTPDQVQLPPRLYSFSLHFHLPTLWETFLSIDSSLQVKLWG